MSFPTQAECDLSKPKEHFLWALRGLSWNDHPLIVPQPILEKWSEHLVETGAVHVLALYKLADENGKIDVKDLPRQKIKYVLDPRSDDHPLNGAGQWLPVDAEEPEQDPLVHYTDAQKRKIAEGLKEEGFL